MLKDTISCCTVFVQANSPCVTILLTIDTIDTVHSHTRAIAPVLLHKAIPIKRFVSHRSPSREGGSVGRAKKKGMN